jgi:Tol biopolymer transport system component
MVMPSDGGEARPLLVLKQPEAFYFGSFTWTPDSRQILAARSRSLNLSPANEKISEIWLVPLDGSAPQKIDFPAMFVTCLRLSPDGKSIAFQFHQDRREVWVLQNFL